MKSNSDKKRLKPKIRKLLNKTQKEICEDLEITQSALSKIENGTLNGLSYHRYLCYLVKHGIDINPLFEE